MKCPICEKDALFVGVHDDEGNYHGLVGCDYESNPWSGLSYALHHEGWGECPLCTDGEYSPMGGMLFDTAEEAITSLTPPNEPLMQSENEKLRAELEQVKRERDAAVEDLHKLCPAWKWDGEPSNLLTVPFTAGRQTPGCGLFRLSGSTARRRDRYIGNGGDQNGATDI